MFAIQRKNTATIKKSVMEGAKNQTKITSIICSNVIDLLSMIFSPVMKKTSKHVMNSLMHIALQTSIPTNTVYNMVYAMSDA